MLGWSKFPAHPRQNEGTNRFRQGAPLLGAGGHLNVDSASANLDRAAHQRREAVEPPLQRAMNTVKSPREHVIPGPHEGGAISSAALDPLQDYPSHIGTLQSMSPEFGGGLRGRLTWEE